ncbi:MAG TPA: fatty acid desaturase, partial [Opitutaceae bacterium]|nr:fatty acid desaturase [Opitutaceae bacterium]
FIGHSIACLGFYAHDLSHGTILRAGRLSRVFETLLWTLAAVPATMWRRVHNATHHVETNTVGDPDRWFLV